MRPAASLAGPALCAALVALCAPVALAAAPQPGVPRGAVPIERSSRTALPSDAVDVRIAMTENDTSALVATSSGGLLATGTSGAKAVMYAPTGNGAWSVATGTGCSGPWTTVRGESVETPLVRPATAGTLLTLCADDHAQLQVQGYLTGVYNSTDEARTVNTLPLEAYVADVVPGESISDWGNVGTPGPQGRPWGFQELEAQAVAVRSYVLASPGGYGGYATTCDLACQTYRGTTYLSANSEAAAKDTAGEVMVMPDGSVASTEYSASTGGYTSSSDEGSPFTPVPDTGDGVCLTKSNPGLCNPSHDWSSRIPLATVRTHWPKEGATPTVTVSARNGHGTWGGRATEVAISGNGVSQTVPSATFVSALALKSNYFTIDEAAGGPLTITGHGWGHGIGMGQWGAFGYAVGTDDGKGNWTWEQIVDHYYAPATIRALPASTAATGGGAFSDSRIAGATADGTAAKELEHQFAATAGRCPGSTFTRPVVLADDAGYADALASSTLARALGTGTLLTPPTRLSAATATALGVEGVTHVYVVGGPLAIATPVLATLRSTPARACGGGPGPGTDLQVTRISGQTQYDTAAEIAAEAATLAGVGTLDVSSAYAGANATGGHGRYNLTAGAASSSPVGDGPLTTAIVADGKGFQDAEAASALAYARRLPVLLTTPVALSPQVAPAIRSLGVRQVLVMGGPLAVSNAVVASLEQLPVSVLRVAGADATGTAVELARLETAASPAGAGWRGTGALTIVRGNGFSDGLAGAVVAADGPGSAIPEPVLLTESPTSVGSALTAYLRSAGSSGIGGVRVDHLTVLGGTLAVTPATVVQMEKDLSS